MKKMAAAIAQRRFDSSGSLAMFAAILRASSQASGLLVTHHPQELGFVNVAVFGEVGD
jgi:hypothetical protein